MLNYQELASRLYRDHVIKTAPSKKLPSIRQVSVQYSTSRSMAERAYELLEAQSLVEGQTKRGFYSSQGEVASGNRTNNQSKPIKNSKFKSLHPSTYGLALSRLNFQSAEEPLAKSNYCRARWQYHVSRSSEQVLKSKPASETREALADYLQRFTGTAIRPDHTFMLWGVYQPFDLICRLLIGSRSSAIFLDQAPRQLANIARSYGTEQIVVPPNHNWQHLRCEDATPSPALLYAVSGQNPYTGNRLDMAECASLATKLRCLLVQDIRFEQATLLRRDSFPRFFDSQSTILWGGFGLSLGDAAPISFLVVPDCLTEQVSAVLRLNPPCIPAQYEAALSVMLRNGQLDKLIQRQRKSILKVRQRLIYLLSTRMSGFIKKIDSTLSPFLTMTFASQFSHEMVRSSAEFAGLPILLNEISDESKKLTIPLNVLNWQDIEPIVVSFATALNKYAASEAVSPSCDSLNGRETPNLDFQPSSNVQRGATFDSNISTRSIQEANLYGQQRVCESK